MISSRSTRRTLPAAGAVVLDRIVGPDDNGTAETARFLRSPGISGVEALHATFVGHRYALHAHQTFTIALVERGAATFELEGRWHTAPAGSVFVIPPGRGHTGQSASAGGYTYKVLYVETGAATDRVGGDPDLPPIRPRVVIDDRALARQLAFTHTLFGSASSTLAAEMMRDWYATH